MKTFFGILIAGVISTTNVFAEEPVTGPHLAADDTAIATPRVPFRLFHKRPAGTRQAMSAAPKVNIATPQLPFRPYQKRPTGTASMPSASEATNR
jgi:hypothetical protein